jgi:T-complex protein 1 subunit epsilon
MSLAFDEFGKPYLIVREHTKKKRTKGIEAVKVNTHTT